MARLPSPEPAARNPMRTYQREFCEWTVTRGLSPNTARLRQWTLDLFIAWCDERGLGHPGEITRPILQRYQRHLYLMRTAKGKPLALCLPIKGKPLPGPVQTASTLVTSGT